MVKPNPAVFSFGLPVHSVAMNEAGSATAAMRLAALLLSFLLAAALLIIHSFCSCEGRLPISGNHGQWTM